MGQWRFFIKSILKIIQYLRNEAHRFAINFHRDQRSRNFLGTSLTNIPGVGQKSAEKLLQHYGSVKKVRAASEENLETVIGKALAKKILKWFAEEGDETNIS